MQPADGPVILVRADAVIDQPLIHVLLERPGSAARDDRQARRLGRQLRGSDVSRAIEACRDPGPVPMPLLAARTGPARADFWKALRKRETPYAMVVTPDNRSAVEWRMFMGTYKGATDLVTKHLWPVPAFHATRFLAPLGVTPNMVTMVAALMVVAGLLAVPRRPLMPGAGRRLAHDLPRYGRRQAGPHHAHLVQMGRLSSTTASISSTRPSGMWPGRCGLWPPEPWSNEVFWGVMTAILGGYVLQRVMEGIAIKWLGLEIHIWRPIDTLFRQITARRNPNLVILTLFTAHRPARLGPDRGGGLDGPLPRPSRNSAAPGLRGQAPQGAACRPG